jgi:hypothetical protein
MSYKDMTSLHTIGELRQRMDPDGMLADIAEVIDEFNDFDGDIPWMEANDKTSHLFTKRVSYGTPSIRRFNQGVTPSKTTTGQDREVIMMTEDWSEVDAKLARVGGDPEGYRYQEDIGFAESFSQAVPGYFFYGTGANEEILGLANRMNATSLTNTYSASGTGSLLSSIYIVDWGRDVFGIYPTGSAAGLDWEDKGLETKESSTTLMEVYRSRWSWDYGLVVRDPRKIARVCNISVATPSAASPAAIDNAVIYALNKMPRGMRGSGVVMYCNSDVMTILDILVKDKTNMNYDWSDKFGRPVRAFRDMIPIRQVDQILSSEDSVS